jgi:site-specific DNA recombinase
MKAAIYARYSSDLQRAASIEDQSRNCRKRADAERWTISATFADAAISGSDRNRPQYKAMLAAAERSEFGVLLLDDLSRLARDSVEQERIIRRLEFRGLRIIATCDGYDSECKARKVHRGFKGLMNEIFLDDLREKTHRGIAGQHIKHFWTGGRPYGYRLRQVMDSIERDQVGQPKRIGSRLELHPEQIEIVLEMFERYADGESPRAIAANLNARGIPSPGSGWRRRVRRCHGWMGSAIYTILMNDLYTGHVKWNRHRYERDPDSKMHKCRVRPKSEWLTYRDESLRIVSDELWERCVRRRTPNSTLRLRCGGRPKFLLSGILRCGVCGASYVMKNRRSYGCGGYVEGRSCANGVDIRRDWAEDALLMPVYKDVLEPNKVELLAKQLQSAYLKCQRLEQSKVAQAPKEVHAVDERSDSLRVPLPDLAPDELAAALAKAEEKRPSPLTAGPPADDARMISMLPNAAADYREQIKIGLAGDEGASLKARVLLRQYFGGQIKLIPAEDGLYAEYLQHRIALLQGIGIGCSPWAIRTYRALVAAWRSAAACSRAVVDVLTALTHRICRLGLDAWVRVTGFGGANRRKLSRLFRRHRRMDFLRAYRRHVRRYTFGAKRHG